MSRNYRNIAYMKINKRECKPIRYIGLKWDEVLNIRRKSINYHSLKLLIHLIYLNNTKHKK